MTAHRSPITGQRPAACRGPRSSPRTPPVCCAGSGCSARSRKPPSRCPPAGNFAAGGTGGCCRRKTWRPNASAATANAPIPRTAGNLVAFAPAGDYTTDSRTATATVGELRAEFAGWDDRLTSSSRTSRLQQVSHARAGLNHLADGPEQEARETDPLAASAWIYDHNPDTPLPSLSAAD